MKYSSLKPLFETVRITAGWQTRQVSDKTGFGVAWTSEVMADLMETAALNAESMQKKACVLRVLSRRM
jgi:hypothetical protein